MAVNWALGLQQGPTPGDRFNQAYERGTEMRRERDMTSALRGLAANPDDPQAMNALIQADPRQAMQFQEVNARRQQAEAQRVREAAQTLGPIYQRMTQMPYELRRPFLQQIASRLVARGIPQEVIANYDPTDQNLQTDLDLSQRAQGEGFTLSEGQVRFDAGGNPIARGAPARPRYYSVPQGGRLELDPSYQQSGEQQQGRGETTAVNPQTGERIRLNPQTGQWEPVQGGPASPAPGNFPQ